MEDAERLLDAVAEHAERPTSMWGCCGGALPSARHYYCDTCALYYHHECQPNQGKGRQRICASCHAAALSDEPRGGRRRVVPRRG